MLWLALHFPSFPLQAIQSAAGAVPCCVHESRRGRAFVVACNGAARRAGVEPGMSLAAARVLAASLQSLARDQGAEENALRRLALWAQQFTPVVSLQPPDGLLLEVAGSLGLFGGPNALRTRIEAALAPLGLSARAGMAPTPAAAWLLARAGCGELVRDHDALARAIEPLPVSLLMVGPSVTTALHQSGIDTLGALLQLPDDALSRRFGPALPRQLARLLGREPDPRRIFEPPVRFRSRLMLPDSVTETTPLLFLLRRLLHELAGFLRGRGAGVQRMALVLIPPQGPVERLTLSLLAPSNDPDHLLRLWQERLERHRLQGPVEGIELSTTAPVPLAPGNLDLFTSSREADEDFTRFLERLQSRLGAEAIQRLCAVDDHRPEKASRTLPWNTTPTPRSQDAFPPRPIWLLDPPRLLCDGGRPRLHGTPLTLLEGPERIESGWWDGDEIRRDYFIARGTRQQTLWIFREAGARRRWFLHGYFG